MSPTYVCPACGFPGLDENPRTAERGGSYEICASCGFEFGYTDEDLGYTYSTWRDRWAEAGMPWDAEGDEPRPPGWDPKAQLERLLAQGPD